LKGSEKIEKMKKENEEIQSKNFTYHPSINRVSRMLSKVKIFFVLKFIIFSKKGKHLDQQKDSFKAKIEKYKEEKKINEMKECYFVPKIDEMFF